MNKKPISIQTCAHGKYINISDKCLECIKMAKTYNLTDHSEYSYFFTDDFVRSEEIRKGLVDLELLQRSPTDLLS